MDVEICPCCGKPKRPKGERYKPPNGQEWNLKQADDLDVNAAPGTFTASGRRTLDSLAYVSDLARAWEGHRYGGQILKDAASPIVVAQKPWTNPRLDCIVETGAGALWVDGGRIGANDFEPKDRVGAAKLMEDRPWQERQMREGRPRIIEGNSKGRWPSNFALVHVPPHLCPACSGDGCEACDGRGVVGGCRRVMVEESCPVCDGSGFVAAEPITETWEEWYEKTRDYGGTREEYDRLVSPGGSSFCGECRGKGVVKRVGVRRVSSESGGKFGKRNSDQFLGAIPNNDAILNGRSYADPDGLETVDAWECESDCPARKLGEMSGESKSIRSMRGELVDNRGDNYGRAGGKRIPNSNYMRGHNDKGTAARFYHQAGWEYERTEMRCSPECPVYRLDEQAGESGSGSGEVKISAGTKRNPSWSERKGIHTPGRTNVGIRDFGDRGGPSRFYHQAGWEFECAESCPIYKLDKQAGKSKSPTDPDRFRGTKKFTGKHYASDDYSLEMERDNIAIYSDEGGRSRYFQQSDWSHEIAEGLATEDPVRYCPKAAKSERSKGLDDFYWRKDKQSPIGFVRITRDEWEALGEEEKRIKAETGKRVSLRAQGNIHPTVKPISLCEWLAKLLLPPKEYAPRRIMIPFAGTMSEGIGALLAGWDEIMAIELYQEHCGMGRARMAFWKEKARLEMSQIEMSL